MSHVTRKNDSCFGQSNGHLAVELQTDPWQLGCIGMREIWLIQNVSGNPIHMSRAEELSTLPRERDITHLCVWHDSFRGYVDSSSVCDIWMSHVTHMDESSHVISLIWISRATRMNESSHHHEWVMSHTWMSHVTQINKSGHAHNSVMLHIWMRALLQKTTSKDKASYASSPPCHSDHPQVLHVHDDWYRICKDHGCEAWVIRVHF